MTGAPAGRKRANIACTPGTWPRGLGRVTLPEALERKTPAPDESGLAVGLPGGEALRGHRDG